MGGSGTNDEINILAIKIAGITDEQAKISHGSGESGRSEVEYRFAWARNCLKLAGMIESSKRAVWSLTALGVSTKTIDGKEVFSKRSKPKKEEHEDPSVSELSWQEKVSAFFAACAIIIMIDLSRLYLGVHYLSDVLTGNVVGCIALIFAISIAEFLISKRATKLHPFSWWITRGCPVILIAIIMGYAALVQ